MKRILGLATLAVLVLLLATCVKQKRTAARQTAERLIEFVNSGDTAVLRGLFTDSVLQLMSADQMLATRDDFLTRFGKLRTVDGPSFQNDSSATVVLRYEQLSLEASLKFVQDGRIRYLAIQPEPIRRDNVISGADNVHDIPDIAALRDAFNADTGFVRLVTLLSPT